MTTASNINLSMFNIQNASSRPTLSTLQTQTKDVEVLTRAKVSRHIFC